MRFVVALDALVATHEPSWFAVDEYDQLWSREVSDDSNRSVRDAIGDVLAARPGDAASPDCWWLADVVVDNDTARVTPHPVAPHYGVDDRGRLLLDPGLQYLTIAQYVRAVDDGCYGSDRHEVVVVPAPATGGNGAIAMTIIEWFGQVAPGVLLAHIGERSLQRLGSAKQRRLQQLADDWAAQRIDSPFQLRVWIDKKGGWFPEILAQRLSLSVEAAEALLMQLGYEKNARGLMQRRNSPEAFRKRQEWLTAEHGDFLANFDEDGWEAAFLDKDPFAEASLRDRLAGVVRRLSGRRRR